MGLMYAVGLIAATFFVLIYANLVSEKSLGNAARYGLFFGLCSGVSMGFGTYSVMPIPCSMALEWFAGTVVEMTVGGVLAGLILKPGS